MNPEVDPYFIDGCGRCPLVATPECKVNTWKEELREIRRILLDCGLNEELKWSMPTYTFHKSNIIILSAFKNYCSLNFVKGSLLADAHNMLTKPGENTNAGRQMRFTDIKEILKKEATIKAYIYEAIEVEKAGIKVEEKKELVLIEELVTILNGDPTLKDAFEALTPGRQRGYNIYFSAPKQSKTRIARIEKFIPKILDGLGFHDR